MLRRILTKYHDILIVNGTIVPDRLCISMKTIEEIKKEDLISKNSLVVKAAFVSVILAAIVDIALKKDMAVTLSIIIAGGIGVGIVASPKSSCPPSPIWLTANHDLASQTESAFEKSTKPFCSLKMIYQIIILNHSNPSGLFVHRNTNWGV